MRPASCEPVRQLISAGLDGHASEVELAAAARHARSCDECRRFQQEVAELTLRLRESERLEPVAALALPTASRSAAGAGRWRRPLLASGMVAALAVSALLGSITSAYRDQRPAATRVPADVRLALLDLHTLQTPPGPWPRMRGRHGRIDLVRYG
ncbi:MAG: zf-HC2 domain-containing protein [Gaiellales bacterium]